jgi:hypothetical protein
VESRIGSELEPEVSVVAWIGAPSGILYVTVTIGHVLAKLTVTTSSRRSLNSTCAD